jgi:peptide/nickel transport system substrate-binding protein
LSTTRKGAKFLALLAGGSLALTACSTGGGGGSSDENTSGGDAGGTQDVTITVAHEQEFGSYNNNTAEENAVKNTVVLNQVLRGFWFFGEDGSVVPDTEFGTFEKTSDDPLTVKYTFADGATWSDGEPIDCDDFLLVWAANSGKYTTGEKDADGNDVPLFSTAGTTGYDIMQKPKCADGDTEVEVTYDEPFADSGQLRLLPPGAHRRGEGRRHRPGRRDHQRRPGGPDRGRRVLQHRLGVQPG